VAVLHPAAGGKWSIKERRRGERGDRTRERCEKGRGRRDARGLGKREGAKFYISAGAGEGVASKGIEKNKVRRSLKTSLIEKWPYADEDRGMGKTTQEEAKKSQYRDASGVEIEPEEDLKRQSLRGV